MRGTPGEHGHDPRRELRRDPGHDPRQVDLLAAIVILMTIVAAWFYFTQSDAPSTAAFIVPSQSVRW